MRRRGLNWILVICYAGLIWHLSTVPSSDIPIQIPLHADKLIHIVEYGILALLVCRAVDKTQTSSLVIIVLVCTFYGLIDEIHQSFTGRFASPWDALADTFGSIAGVLVWRRWRK